MAQPMSKIAILGNHTIDWLSNLDQEIYQIDLLPYAGQDFTETVDQQYHLLVIQDDVAQLDLDGAIYELNRSHPFLSIVVVTSNTDVEYSLRLIESGVQDVFLTNDNINHLIRRLNLVLKFNHSKRKSIRLTRDLNAVTILSRRLHNANHPNNLIIDALNIVSSTFNLMGVIIVLQSGNHFHVRAGNSSRDTSRRVYDVKLRLHPYDPIVQSIAKNLVFVFEDLSLNQYIADIPIFDKLQSAIIVPLTYSNITLGALIALGTPTNPLTRDDIVIYEHLSTHLGSAYQNVRDAYTQDVSAKTSRHILRVWQHLSKVYTAKEIDQTMLSFASEIPSIKNALLWMYTETSVQPNVYANNSETVEVFQNLYSGGIITEYINQFDAQLKPLTIWLGRSNARNIGDLFHVMGAQQLIFVPIKDDARLLGCILVSSNSTEPLSIEDLSLLEGIAYAAGQTLARNMLISYRNQEAERLEAITRSMKDGIFFVTEDQTVVFCNPQFSELTGISPSQVLNQSVQSLVDRFASQSNKSEQVRLELELAIQQISNASADIDYPIIEIDIPKTNSQVYMEFIALHDDSESMQKSWIGILNSNRVYSSDYEIANSVMDSVVKHLQIASKDIYERTISLNNNIKSPRQKKLLNEVRGHTLEIEQSLNNVQSLYLSNQSRELDLAQYDPNNLLSIVLSQPNIRAFSKLFDIKTTVKGQKIYVNRKHILQTIANLIESAVHLADKNKKIQIYMGTQTNQFVFRIIIGASVFPVDQVDKIKSIADLESYDLPYSLKLRLFFSHQLAAQNDWQLSIKGFSTRGMQLNLLIPIDEINPDYGDEIQLTEYAPERKPSSIMIYDDEPRNDDVDYEPLKASGYELIYCNQLDQIQTDLNLIRVDLIILTTRRDNDRINNYVEKLRHKHNVTKPILVLSTDTSTDRRIQALKAGIDTLLPIPITRSELLAQVENLFERSKLPERVQEPLTIGKLFIDFAQRQIMIDDKHIDLTRIEYELLSYLALNKGQTLTHSELLAEVWGPEYRDEKQYLWVNMSRLRRKLENTQDKTRYIFTQPGVGYILKDEQ